jgi:uncharacterized membrane protein YqjE
MAGDTMRSRVPAGHAGLLNNLLELAGALFGFFESRAELFAKESKTALIRLLLITLCLVAAVMLFSFGYVFLIAGAIVGIARLAQISWVGIALAAAGLHIVVGLFLIVIAQAKMKKPLFRATIEELKKDREWLSNLDETTLS